ncbi:MAG: S8 family serine peptidase [Burkholderiales bacterium]|nr:S8 family serine peptidase [Burkholderiales bacterium]
MPKKSRKTDGVTRSRQGRETHVPEFVPGKLIVRFRGDALAPARSMLERGARAVRRVRDLTLALPEQVSAPLEMLKRRCGVKRIDPLLAPPPRGAAAAGMTRMTRGVLSLAASVECPPRDRLAGYNVIELEEKDVSEETLRAIQASRAVEFAERVPNRWVSARRKKAAADPSLNLQWGLRAIEWFAAAKRPSAAQVHVAVLDTGVDAKHPDLKGAIEAYHRGGHSAKDLPGHGTHVAGIIAALANNGVGIAGVADCRLHVWKVFSDPAGPRAFEEFDDEAYNRALGAVLDSPARIVNLSLGGTASSRAEQDLIGALVAEGVLVVAAMGNAYEEGNPVEYPAAYADVLAVGAITEARRRAAFSGTGRHINLVAPGEHILSTLPTYGFAARATDYDAWDGTSMAAPHVAGVAALLKAQNPKKGGAWIGKRLEKTALRLPAMRRKKFSAAYGHGLVSVARALL